MRLSSPEHRFFALFMEKAGFSDRSIIFAGTEEAEKTLKELLALTTGYEMGELSGLPRAAIMSVLRRMKSTGSWLPIDSRPGALGTKEKMPMTHWSSLVAAKGLH